MAHDPDNPNPFPLQRDPVTGHLTRQDCPDNPCGTGPEMLLTVTGSSGTINWGGETWVLPGESGVEKSVCPFCIGPKTVSGVPTIATAYATQHWHGYHECGVTGLDLKRHVSTFRTSRYARFYRVGNGILLDFNYNRVEFVGHTAAAEDRIGFFGGFSPYKYARPVAITYASGTMGTKFKLELGLLADAPGVNVEPAGELLPTPDYAITSRFFGSHTQAGVTYTWAQGTGWP